MEREWKIGDWVEYKGIRMMVFHVGQEHCRVVDCSGNSDYFSHICIAQGRVKHLYECTGWDWEPAIEPPAGYRLLGRDERVCAGDLVICKQKREWREAKDKCIGCTAGFRIDSYGVIAYARKIEPQYRPFLDGAEFAPHRDRWVMDKSGKLLARPFGYSRDGVHFISAMGHEYTGDYQRLFGNITFDDGTPFGVEVQQ